MIQLNKVLQIIALCISLIACSANVQKVDEINEDINIQKPTEEVKILIPVLPKVKGEILLGIDVLEKSEFDILENKRVGLITNQTGVNNNLKSTIDILFESPKVNLIALYGPEHGVRGDVEGGKYISSYVDTKTNLQVYSLYGKTRKPSKEMLKNIDILIYDIQDIGVRSYTFISTMGLAIEAASENNIEFVVLDRPNPLGGKKVEGNIVEDDFISFIGQYPIPYVYGLTCGELAKLLIGEKFIKTSSQFKLSVVPMENWTRNMTWEDTNLEWIPTSPHIPHSFSPFYYPMTGILGELRSTISIGVGYTLPFQIVGAEWIDSHKLTDELNNMSISGLFFRPITFKPYYAFGKGKTLHGAQIHIADYAKVNLINTQFYILSALYKLYPKMNLFDMAAKNEKVMFNKAIGTDKISEFYQHGSYLSKSTQFLNKDINIFERTKTSYHLYN